MSKKYSKLKITAYSDEKFTKKVNEGEFETLLNPESYIFKYKVEINNTQAAGTSANAVKFTRIPPVDFDLDFFFDRTGAIMIDGKNNKDEGKGIIDDVEKLKKVVLAYNGDEHKPNYLKIAWGTLLFNGILTEMDITFKLFKPDGTPLRAVAKAKFKGFIEDELRVAKENSQSPDLTHVREVKDGDKLPLMTFRIYGDSKYYLEVARVNGITNFRKLVAGQQIFFPPIEELS